MKVEWNEYDSMRKDETTPKDMYGVLVWIHDEYYEGVTLGYFDGFTFRTWAGSDDCGVTHWAYIERPDKPE